MESQTSTSSPGDIRLLALDLDGTLLDSRGRLRPRVSSRVRDAVDVGLDVVVCTGRRFRTARPLLRALGLEGAAVVQNGVVVKCATSGETLRHRYLSRELCEQVLERMRPAGAPFLYVDSQEVPPDYYLDRLDSAHPFQLEYLMDNAFAAHFVPRLEAVASEARVMVSLMAEAEQLSAVREQIQHELGDRVRTHLLENKNYRGYILEALCTTASKWSAVRELAEQRGIAPQEIAAIGDDENDAEMLAGAGIGIAMGNATERARAAAARATGHCDREGAADAIEWLLDGR